LSGSGDACKSLLKLQLSELDAIRLRAVFLALIMLLSKGNRQIRYSFLAQQANSLYPVAKIPVIGASLGKILGKILGDLSTISWCTRRFFISAVVVNQSGVPGKGFKPLVKTLLNVNC